VEINPIPEFELRFDAIAYSPLSSTNIKATLTCVQWLQDVSARLRLKNDVIRKKGLPFVDCFKWSLDLDRRRSSIFNSSLLSQAVNVPDALIIGGFTGSGKTRLVYDCAEQAGFEVFELSTSDPRDETAILRLYDVAKIALARSNQHEKSDDSPKIPLLLIDDVRFFNFCVHLKEFLGRRVL
jgi:late competence protein required for DNA uptake (superfamily II DNA/RNA helicase)